MVGLLRPKSFPEVRGGPTPSFYEESRKEGGSGKRAEDPIAEKWGFYKPSDGRTSNLWEGQDRKNDRPSFFFFLFIRRFRLSNTNIGTGL